MSLLIKSNKVIEDKYVKKIFIAQNNVKGDKFKNPEKFIELVLSIDDTLQNKIVYLMTVKNDINHNCTKWFNSYKCNEIYKCIINSNNLNEFENFMITNDLIICFEELLKRYSGEMLNIFGHVSYYGGIYKCCNLAYELLTFLKPWWSSKN